MNPDYYSDGTRRNPYVIAFVFEGESRTQMWDSKGVPANTAEAVQEYLDREADSLGRPVVQVLVARRSSDLSANVPIHSITFYNVEQVSRFKVTA